MHWGSPYKVILKFASSCMCPSKENENFEVHILAIILIGKWNFIFIILCMAMEWSPFSYMYTGHVYYVPGSK